MPTDAKFPFRNAARGGTHNPQLDEEIYPLNLSPQQKRDLVAFLREGLSSPDYPYIEPPELP